MKWLGKSIFLAAMVLVSFTVFGPKLSAQSAQNFVIKSFNADYYLDRNSAQTSTMQVKEVIAAQFPDIDQNHGILRALPESYQDHTISLNINSVTDAANNPINYTTSEQNGNLVLKIGDADRFVHGLQTYVISYDMKNVTANYSDHDELFWDANGDQWSQPLASVSATVHIPSSLASTLHDKSACYVGYAGSNNQTRCVSTVTPQQNDEKTAVFSSYELSPGETLSFVLGFDAGTFKLGPEIAQEKHDKKVRQIEAIVVGATLPFVVFWYLFSRWRKFGNDPKGRGVIIPQYEPPKRLDPIYSDFLLKEQMRGKAISALLIGLATKKALSIYEIPKKGLFGRTDYRLELGELPVDISPDAKKAVELIFDGDTSKGSSVLLSEVKKRMQTDTSFYKDTKQLEKSISDRLYTLGYFIKDPLKIKRRYRLWSTLPFVLGIVAFQFTTIHQEMAIGLGIGLIATSVIMIVFSTILPARSLAGVEARDELLGLKDYIKLAEADRLKFLQSPSGAEKIYDKDAFNPQKTEAKVKLFETLLPYAMIFELEKDWAKQFQDIYTQPPDWYHGNWSTFNTIYLANSLGGFSSNSALSFSSPSSSSGSGFGGGGGAGGGGGGGGGGGW